MPAKRRTKNGATRATISCDGSNQAMKTAPSGPVTSRKRTKAFILCMSRRTALAARDVHATSSSVTIFNRAGSSWVSRHSMQ